MSFYHCRFPVILRHFTDSCFHDAQVRAESLGLQQHVSCWPSWCLNNRTSLYRSSTFVEEFFSFRCEKIRLRVQLLSGFVSIKFSVGIRVLYTLYSQKNKKRNFSLHRNNFFFYFFVCRANFCFGSQIKQSQKAEVAWFVNLLLWIQQFFFKMLFVCLFFA